jgi:hypothetical protein
MFPDSPTDICRIGVFCNLFNDALNMSTNTNNVVLSSNTSISQLRRLISTCTARSVAHYGQDISRTRPAKLTCVHTSTGCRCINVGD